MTDWKGAHKAMLRAQRYERAVGYWGDNARALFAMLRSPRWRPVALRVLRGALTLGGQPDSAAAQALGIDTRSLLWVVTQVPELEEYR